MTNDKKVENVASAESEEEAENAVAEIKEDEKDEEIEIVAEAKMKKGRQDGPYTSVVWTRLP